MGAGAAASGARPGVGRGRGAAETPRESEAPPSPSRAFGFRGSPWRPGPRREDPSLFREYTETTPSSVERNESRSGIEKSSPRRALPKLGSAHRGHAGHTLTHRPDAHASLTISPQARHPLYARQAQRARERKERAKAGRARGSCRRALTSAWCSSTKAVGQTRR